MVGESVINMRLKELHIQKVKWVTDGWRECD